jgi:hypothetical protein
MGQFLDQGKLIPLRQNGIYTLPTCVILTESVGWDLVASVYWRTKIRSFSAHKRHGCPQFNMKPVALTFGQGDLSWKPGHLRSYGAICCHRFKPKNMTDDIFLAQILRHKLLGPNASLSVGQSYKDFYVK